MEEFYKEIAKMIIDIMKYLITGVIITSVFGTFEDQRSVNVIAFALVLICCFASFIIFRVFDNNKNSKLKKRRK